MEPHDELLTGEAQDYGGGEVFALPGVAYAIYLPRGNPSGSLDMTSASGRFYRRWYNPRTGQFAGLVPVIQGGGMLNLGSPPGETNEDWVVLVKALPNYDNHSYLPAFRMP